MIKIYFKNTDIFANINGKAVLFSAGGPSFPKLENVDYAIYFVKHSEYNLFNYRKTAAQFACFYQNSTIVDTSFTYLVHRKLKLSTKEECGLIPLIIEYLLSQDYPSLEISKSCINTVSHPKEQKYLEECQKNQKIIVVEEQKNV